MVARRLTACPPTPAGRDALRALADRLPAHRRRAHRALQLALCPAHRRQLPAADRGHRPRPLDARGDRGDLRGPALARPRLGRRGDQPVRARRRATPRSRTRWWRAAPPTAATRRVEEIEAFRDAGQGRGPAAALPLALARRRSRDRAATRPTSSGCAPRATARPWSRTWCRARVTWKNETLDDLILLRSDGTPTYMLAVVVDDHDMGVTHVIRGDDHLTNAARQTLIYRAMGWDGAGLRAHPADPRRRRRQALQAPRRARGRGLPRHGLSCAEAMRNYLARLGWSHGNDEFFTTEQAIAWFDLSHLGKAPARFDFAKLESLSGQHIRAADDAALLAEVEAFLAAQNMPALDRERSARRCSGRCPGSRSARGPSRKSLTWPALSSADRPVRPRCRGRRRSSPPYPPGCSADLTSRLQKASWTAGDLEAVVRDFAAAEGLGLGKIAQPLRVALSGRTVSLAFST